MTDIFYSLPFCSFCFKHFSFPPLVTSQSKLPLVSIQFFQL
jgi:hypothetical protein